MKLRTFVLTVTLACPFSTVLASPPNILYIMLDDHSSQASD